MTDWFKDLFIDEARAALETHESGGSGGGSSEGLPTEESDVKFYDYDGTLLYGYTKKAALSLTEMPELPTKEGLVCQEWNWSLEDMQAYVNEYGKCNVGATYITDDGKTRIYITLPEGRTSPMLGVCPKGTVTVDWGDGSEPDILTGTSTTTVKWTPNHHYSAPGNYVISLTVDGDMGFYYMSSGSLGSILLHSSSGDDRNRVYANAIKKIEIGNGITSIGSAFSSYKSLTSVVIPNSVTSINSAFKNCSSLTSIIIPNGVTVIGYQMCYSCTSLTSVVIPNSVTSIEQDAFDSCSSLTSIIIPNSVTSISGAFESCSSLTSIIIPNSITTIANSMFTYCTLLTSITIPDSVTSIGQNAFKNCKSLTSVVIPNSVTSIGKNAFDSCSSLTSIIIPNGVTSIDDYVFGTCDRLNSVTISNGVTVIGRRMFYNCTPLTSVVIPNSVTSIGGSAFGNCGGLAICDFTACTSVVTLGDSDVFINVPDDCEIRVPAALYDEWIAAPNWSSYADRIVAV